MRDHLTGRETDDIGNLCFIAGRTNRQISDKAPEQYFDGLLKNCGVEPFDAQCIPTDKAFLGVEQYSKFLDERRVRIARRLNEFFGNPPTGEDIRA